VINKERKGWYLTSLFIFVLCEGWIGILVGWKDKEKGKWELKMGYNMN